MRSWAVARPKRPAAMTIRVESFMWNLLRDQSKGTGMFPPLVLDERQKKRMGGSLSDVSCVDPRRKPSLAAAAELDIGLNLMTVASRPFPRVCRRLISDPKLTSHRREA